MRRYYGTTAFDVKVDEWPDLQRELQSSVVVTTDLLERLKQFAQTDERGHSIVVPRSVDVGSLKSAINAASKKPYSTWDWLIVSLQKSQAHLRSSGPLQTVESSHLPRFSSFWNENFALLSAKYNLSYPLRLRVAEMCIDEAAGEVAAKLLLAPNPMAIDGLAFMRATWDSPLFLCPFLGEEARNESRRDIWCNMMLWILQNRPESAAEVLVATYTCPYPSFHMVAYALEYLAAFYLQDSENYVAVEAKTFRSAVSYLLQNCDEAVIYLTQKTIFLLATRSNLQQLQFLYSSLQNLGAAFGPDTCLQVAYGFGTFGDFERGLDALEHAVALGEDPLSNNFMSCFNRILRFSIANPEGYRANSYIVSRFLELGGVMNQRLYAVLMINAVEVGDMKMVLRVFNLLGENGMEPNESIYRALIKGCKNYGDLTLTTQVLHDAEKFALETQHVPLSNDVLHLHCVSWMQRTPGRRDNSRVTQSEFDSLVAVYLKFFSASPLVALGLVAGKKLPSNDRRKRPDPVALNIMLTAFLRMSPGSEQNDVVYQRFSEILKGTFGTASMREIMVDMTMGETTYNIFLLALSVKKENLPRCTELVRAMSMGLPTDILPKDALTGEAIQPCKPTVRIFSTLLYAFARHGQNTAAEKVISLMRSRGLAPNRVTWTTLIHENAKQQNVEGMARALKGMNDDGFGIEEEDCEMRYNSVVNAFARIHDKRGLQIAMQRQRVKWYDMAESDWAESE